MTRVHNYMVFKAMHATWYHRWYLESCTPVCACVGRSRVTAIGFRFCALNGKGHLREGGCSCCQSVFICNSYWPTPEVCMRYRSTHSSGWAPEPCSGAGYMYVSSSILLILRRHTHETCYIDLHMHKSCMHVTVRVLHSSAFIISSKYHTLAELRPAQLT